MAKTFSAQLRNFAQATDEKTDRVVRKTVFGIGSFIILKTPVDTGRARANWQYGTETAPAGALDITDKSGGATVARVSGAIAPHAARVTHYYANNLPYALSLEYGSSTQAPQGMVRLALQKADEILAQAVASEP